MAASGGCSVILSDIFETQADEPSEMGVHWHVAVEKDAKVADTVDWCDGDGADCQLVGWKLVSPSTWNAPHELGFLQHSVGVGCCRKDTFSQQLG